MSLIDRPAAEREVRGGSAASSRDSRRCSRVFGLAIVAASLAWLLVVGGRLIARQSVTVDEPGHIGAGLSYWVRRDFAISTGNFFFTQKWAAWPLVQRENPAHWQQMPREREAHAVGRWFLFSGASSPQTLLAPARWMTLGLCAALAVLVTAWAFYAGGGWAAALAALLFVTSPVNLAYGVLVTADTGAAWWWLLALFLYDRMLRRPGAVLAIATGASLAMLLLSKFTLPYWLLVAGVLLAWHLTSSRERATRRALLVCHGLVVVAAWTAIWAFFGFAYRPGGTPLPFPPVSGAWQLTAQTIADWRLVPEPFARELAVIPSMLQPRPAYLLGEYRVGTHWLYFPVALLAKSTLASLLAAGAWCFVWRWRKGGEPDSDPSLRPVAIGIAGLSIAALFSPLNIGVRHILPVYALLAIAGGVALTRLAGHGRMAKVAAFGIALLAVGEGVSAARRPMAWCNAAFGGSMAGYRIVNDSSLEWGGDVPDLIAWHERLPVEERRVPVFASVLGPPLFRPYGLAADDLVAAFERGEVRPGYFVFSATRLSGGMGLCYGKPPAELADAWHARPDASWRHALDVRTAELAASRLAAYCRLERTAGRIGPVYFVYRLTDEDMTHALGR